MRRNKQSGFTLVELLVVIAIIGTLVGLLLPAVQSAREAGRRNTCLNRIRQLTTALTIRETSEKKFPGYINTIGLTGTNLQSRASWVVMTFPHIELQQVYDIWSQGNRPLNDPSATQDGPPTPTNSELLICPSNPPVSEGEPNLAYVANAGRMADNERDQENPANGLFFDRTRLNKVGSVTWSGSADIRDNSGAPMQSMSIAYLQGKGDGTTKTLMLSESLRALYWMHVPGDDYRTTPDANFQFGFTWPDLDTGGSPYSVASNPLLRINGTKEPTTNTQIGEMQILGSNGPTGDGLPSSNHPGGVNVSFVGGQAQFLSESLDPLIYAQLMTSNRNVSDLVSLDNVQEKNLREPPDDAY